MEWTKPEKAEKGPLHPEGTFDAVVVGAKDDTTANGKLMFRLEFKTSQGQVKGRLIYSPENKKAVWAFHKQLEALGADEKFFADGPEPADVALQILKARCLIRVEHEDYQGETFASVDWIEGIPDNGIKPSAPVDNEDEPF